MEYYFTPKEYISQSSLTIVDEEAKHLARVLRKSAGEEIFVTDGLGNLYKTKISSVNKNLIECSIIEKFTGLNESPLKINLYQSLIKNPDRFEFAIEKSVELGVYSIHPVITENVINKTTDKTQRWQSISLSAMKQSQRCFLPRVYSPAEFNDAVKSCEGLKLIAHEKAMENSVTLHDELIKDYAGDIISLFIGPEGGFTGEEIDIALNNGFKVLNLGSRKYRSETAAILSAGLLLNK